MSFQKMIARIDIMQIVIRVCRRLRRAIALCLPMVFSACVSTSSLDVPTQEPADIEERVVIDGQALPYPDQPSLTTESVGESSSVSPVVRRLMASAQSSRQAKNWDSAADSIERALRIEPRNAALWSALAEVKYDQGDDRSTLQFAAKSNTLSGQNRQLRRKNWLLMANSQERLGDTSKATELRKRAFDN